MLSVDKNLEIYLYYSILSFGLLVNLRVENHRELLLAVKESAKQDQELWYKNLALITDYRFQKTIISYYYIDNHFYKTNNIDYDFKQFVVDHFGKKIKNDENWIIIFAFIVC